VGRCSSPEGARVGASRRGYPCLDRDRRRRGDIGGPSTSNEGTTSMTDSTQKVAQYLEEARAMELSLVSDLQSQIAMTPRGTYRSLLEKHLRETRGHADGLSTRLDELDHGSSPLEMVGGVAQKVIGQVMAVGKAPLNIVRGSGGEEKVLKNAKDSCAAEALEIATYIAVERLANAVNDERTAKLAASIRDDEEKMLEALRDELPKLTDAVVRADIYGDPSYDLGTIGAVDAVKETAEEVVDTAREVGESARRATREARKVPGVAQAEGEIKGAFASEEDLAIPNYDELTAEDIVAKLPQLSQIDLAKVDAYERKNQDRVTVLNKIASLRGDEPWPGYDELTVSDVQAALRDADAELAEKVRAYEASHKNRSSVLKATERKLAAV
jgi:ferritin-like metal-binding protein YciE